MGVSRDTIEAGRAFWCRTANNPDPYVILMAVVVRAGDVYYVDMRGAANAPWDGGSVFSGKCSVHHFQKRTVREVTDAEVKALESRLLEDDVLPLFAHAWYEARYSKKGVTA